MYISKYFNLFNYLCLLMGGWNRAINGKNLNDLRCDKREDGIKLTSYKNDSISLYNSILFLCPFKT
jgi:hypothetical protein